MWTGPVICILPKEYGKGDGFSSHDYIMLYAEGQKILKVQIRFLINIDQKKYSGKAWTNQVILLKDLEVSDLKL